MTDVRFPTSKDFEALCDFSHSVDRLHVCEKLRFTTGHVRFFTPTSMIFLAKTCRKRSRKHKTEDISYLGLNRHGYANNLGFSDALSLKGKPYPQGAFGGETYIPMSAFRRDELEETAMKIDGALGDAIQEKCEDIARVVSQRRTPELQEVLANSFREIFRNSFEHSGKDAAVFCVQYWPKLDLVEICIADRGMGVTASLEENKYLPSYSDDEAISVALMPGVSSKAWRHRKKKSAQKSEWDNSGYGLFFAHQLFGSLGSFGIASGNSALEIKDGVLKEYKCDVEGTLVSMQLKLSNEDAIQKTISNVKKTAAKVKETIGTRNIDVASVKAFLDTGSLK